MRVPRTRCALDLFLFRLHNSVPRLVLCQVIYIAKEKRSYTGKFLKEIFVREQKDLKERKAVSKEKIKTIDQIRGRRAKKVGWNI